MSESKTEVREETDPRGGWENPDFAGIQGMRGGGAASVEASK